MFTQFSDTMTKPKKDKKLASGTSNRSGKSRSAKKKKTAPAPVPYHAKRWIRRKSIKLRPGTLRSL
jgi:hypothetical protein